ncbi:hypothetical protein FOMPIDRAFT_23382, partial [Fomitopsis schrenkii]
LRRSTLKGFRIPGAARRLVASLFADDTSTFLAASDRWTVVWAVIHKWCRGSRAKFNNGKTEVIPVGHIEYRAAVIASRTISGVAGGDPERIPEGIRIAHNREAVRILGAWIGNGVEQVAVWAPAMKKMKDFLERWGRCHPSMGGKRSIVQMGPGGISQYLTCVQGMPRQIEDEIAKTIQQFMWDGKSP